MRTFLLPVLPDSLSVFELLGESSLVIPAKRCVSSARAGTHEAASQWVPGLPGL
jgi:hypothetical protein